MDFGYFHAGAHLAADFVNTKGWLTGKERLGPEEARTLLRAAGGERRVTKADMPKLYALRDRVRAVFTAPDDATARRQIATLLADYPAQLGLTAGAEHNLTFTPAGRDAVSWLGANVAVGLAFFVAEHGTTRFGICGASDCADAFVDESKNRTKHYCSAGCTRLENVRAFRTRKRSAS